MACVNIKYQCGTGRTKIFEIDDLNLYAPVPSTGSLADKIKARVTDLLDANSETFYLTHNGKLLSNCSDQLIMEHIEVPVIMVPRALGGKGGFGSMLRAIGAQIEKTTNREACRDLSGRRLRDINEEQRLKRWFAKQKQREEEKEELKRKKLEKLRQFCEGAPLPLTQDPEYNRQRAEMADSVFDAVDKGFEASISEVKSETSVTASTSTAAADEEQSSSSSSSEPQPGSSSTMIEKSAEEPKKEKLQTIKRTLFDEDLDSDVSDSSSEDEVPSKKARI